MIRTEVIRSEKQGEVWPLLEKL